MVLRPGCIVVWGVVVVMNKYFFSFGNRLERPHTSDRTESRMIHEAKVNLVILKPVVELKCKKNLVMSQIRALVWYCLLNIMAVFDILLLAITNNPKLTLPNKFTIPPTNPVLSHISAQIQMNLLIYCNTVTHSVIYFISKQSQTSHFEFYMID